MIQIAPSNRLQGRATSGRWREHVATVVGSGLGMAFYTDFRGASRRKSAHSTTQYGDIYGVQPTVTDTSPLRKPPYGVDATMSLHRREASCLWNIMDYDNTRSAWPPH